MVTPPANDKPQKAIVIHSPYSGKSNFLTDTIATLKTTRIEIADVISIAELDVLPNQGEDWKKSGINLAIAAGGDGVVGGVITHIAESGLLFGDMSVCYKRYLSKTAMPQNSGGQ